MNKKKTMLDLTKEIGKEVSEKTYYNTIGFMLLYGFLMNIFMVMNLSDFVRSLHPIIFILGYFVITITGVIMLCSSKNTIKSFIGYNFIVLPIGLLLTIILPNYPIEMIAKSFVLTSIITIEMMIISTICPKLFQKLGKTLLISLISCIIVEIIFIFLGIPLGFINDIICCIFILYIGYDWQQASTMYKSIPNAILVASNLYLDIINIFVRLLEND